MNKIKEILIKYKEIILYLIFGGLTTLVNIVVYFVSDKIGLSTTVSTVLAWLLSVIFAFITNRKFVFESKATSIPEILKEMISFFSCRLATGVADLVVMVVFVDILHFYGLLIKILSNVMVVILNYVFSKLIIFKDNKEKKNRRFKAITASFFTKVTGWCVILFSIYIFGSLLLNIFLDKKYTNYFLSNLLNTQNITLIGFSLVLFAFIIVSILFLRKSRKLCAIKEKITDKQYYLILGFVFLVIFAVQIIISGSIWFKTDWDVWYVVNNAENIAYNGANTVDASYFSMYPNNLVLVYVVAFVLKIGSWFLEDPYLLLLWVNAFLVCISLFFAVLSIYKIVKSRTITNISVAIGVVLIAFNPWIVIPYSDTFGMIFSAFAVFSYFYISNNYLKYFLITLSLSVGYFIKPTVIIVFIALAICLICKFIAKALSKQIDLKQTSKIGVLILLSFIISFCGKLSINYIDKTVLDENKEITMTHFLMMGMNRECDGVYSQDDVLFSQSFDTKSDRQEANLRVAGERVKEMGIDGLTKHLIRKNISIYNDGMFGWAREGKFYYDMNESETAFSSFLRNYYYSYNSGYQMLVAFNQVVWLMLLISISFCMFGKKSFSESWIAISLIGVSMFLLLFEVRARYLFIFMPLYLILASIGLNKASTFLFNKKD